MTDQPLRVLVLCTGNACRSQMTEGFLDSLGKGAIEANSAGVKPAGLSSRAVKAMAEVGIDISDHISEHLEKYLHGSFDYIITVCDNAAANCPVFPGGGVRLHWPFDDPAAAKGSDDEVMNQFRRVPDEIRVKVEEWLASQG